MLNLLPGRWAQVALLFAAILTCLGAGNTSGSFDQIGHQLVCQCSCGQILLECNHVGCPVSGPMIEELKTQLGTGLPPNGVLNWFSQKYGPIVLAAPIRGGFDVVAWIVPFAVLALGFLAVFVLMRLWSRKQVPATVLEHVDTSAGEILLDRIRRDTDYRA